MSKTKKIFWKTLWTAAWGWMGYSLMDLLINYSDNMRRCGENFDDLYERIEKLESPEKSGD